MATKSKTLLYCAVCLNQYQAIVVRGSDKLARHGFNIVGAGRGHGLLGSWHTGPCAGYRFPHLGISTEGTRAALTSCQEALTDTEDALVTHAKRPALTWTYTPSKWQVDAARRAGKPAPEPVTYTVKPGASRDYANDGPPSYDDLWEREGARLVSRAKELVVSIATYVDVIATWTAEKYAPVVTEARGPIMHAGGIWRRARVSQGRVVAPLCQEYAMRPPYGGRIAATAGEITCTRCRKALAPVEKKIAAKE